jgi:hypothetical protein
MNHYVEPELDPQEELNRIYREAEEELLNSFEFFLEKNRAIISWLGNYSRTVIDKKMMEYLYDSKKEG